MIINEIEYYVCLYIIVDDDWPEYEAHFRDFYELNAFINKNIDNPRYINNKIGYSLVEAIDGEPDSFGWINSMLWSEFSETKIQQEIYDFLEFEKENVKENTRVENFSKEIHYFEEAEDYRKKQYLFKDFAYVCPKCIREVTDCRCAQYPWYLVQIDKLMVPIIRELNSKGYRTTGCCAGHLKESSFDGSSIYISFAEEYKFDTPFPEGCKYSKARHTLYYQLPENCEDLVSLQREILWRLEDWAELLFEVDFFISDDDEL